jgi:hypothetical protein
MAIGIVAFDGDSFYALVASGWALVLWLTSYWWSRRA